MSMSQNSIKILKNQSKWQKRKRVLLLGFLIIIILFAFSFILFHFMKDDTVSLNSENELIKPIEVKEQVQDLSGDHLESPIDSSKNTLEQIFKRDDAKTEPNISENTGKTPIKLLPKEDISVAPKVIKVEIPKKLPEISKPPTAVIKSVPSTATKVDTASSSTARLDKPFKIDSMDAIILLELDIPVSQDNASTQ